MSDQRPHIDLLIGKELNECLHVAGLGPAHVTDRIVTPLLLISGIVTTRTVGARDAEVEFLFVIRLSLDVHTDRPHGHDDTAIACDGASQVDGIAAGGFGGDQDTVNACSARTLSAEIAKG